MGSTTLGEKASPIFKTAKRNDNTFERLDGACDNTGVVFGTYLHGLFDDPPLRRALVGFLCTKVTVKDEFSP